MARIYPDDIHWDDDDIVRVLKMSRKRLEKIVGLMDADDLSAWRDILSGARKPGPGEILGVHWSHAEAMLEAGDIEQIKDWIKPFIRELQPRPKFKAKAS